MSFSNENEHNEAADAFTDESARMNQDEEVGASEAVGTSTDSGKKTNSVTAELISYIKTIALAFIIALFLTNFVIINCQVPTGSMLDTIQLKDRLIGSRLTYLYSEPKRGDIVIFPCPDNGKTYIKRLIGLPGETIEVIGGKVYINGSDTPLDEPYVPEKYLGGRDFGPYTIPEGCYFMLGDHRNSSADSRYWKTTCVERKDILAKALFIYFPFNHIDMLAEKHNY